MCFLLAFGDFMRVSEVAVTYPAGCVCPLWGIWATRVKEETKQAEGREMRECVL